MVVIKDESRVCPTLSQRMAELHIPGVSIAVIHNGAIEWARGFGLKQTGGVPIGADTLFQAGSISKPLAAMAALHQVDVYKRQRRMTRASTGSRLTLPSSRPSISLHHW